MNIAVFTRSTIEHFASGGMETQLDNLLTGLAKMGYSITVFTTSYPYGGGVMDNDHEVESNGIRYVYIGGTTSGLRPMSMIEKFYYTLGFLKRGTPQEGKKNYFDESCAHFDNMHQNEPFDVIVSQSTMALGILKSQYTNGEKGSVPIVSIIHGTIKAELKNRFGSNKSFTNWVRFFINDIPNWMIELYTTNRKFYERCDAIIAVSEALKTHFHEDHPSCDNKVHVIYNGVDENVFVPHTEKFDIFTMLYIGRMDREKGVDTIIEAASILKEKKIPFQVNLIGGGIDHHVTEFKELAEKYQLTEEVQFIGEKKNTELPDYYSKSHVFVFPTRRQEGHPMTISESFCSGLPVIATPNGGIKELIDDGVTGYFIEENNPDMLVEKVLNLYENEQAREDMSKHAYEVGITKFSQTSMVTQYDTILTTVKHFPVPQK